MNRILIVDDEPDIRKLIRLHLEQAGWNVSEAESEQQAITQLQDQPVSLMVLDIMINDGKGLKVLRYIREYQPKTLVIVLSASGTVEDKIEALGLGADDYMIKPFHPLELLARIQAHTRRHLSISLPQANIIQLNKLILDIDNYVLNNDGQVYTLTPVECALLQVFMRNPDRVLSKREIYMQIWQHENYDDNNLSVFVSRLRKMLEKASSSKVHLHTVRGIGYRFSGKGH